MIDHNKLLMTKLNPEILAEKREINRELTSDELETVFGGGGAWTCDASAGDPVCTIRK